LNKDLLRGIYGFGFEKPSPIQAKAILPIIQNRDVIAQAQSGTGKTGAFVVSILQLINPNQNEVQAVILCPTRELTKQNTNVFQLIGEYTKIKCHAFIGGTSVKNDKIKAEEGVHIVVGTPGRVLDLLSKKIIKLDYLKIFCLDEADDMLSRGFLEDIKKVFPYIPTTSQMALFSATMPKEILELTKQFMNKPVKILVKREMVALEGIKQYKVPVKREWKLEVLIQLYKMMEISQAMIFCNNKKTVEYLQEEMIKRGHGVSAIHAEMEMNEREKVMKEFRFGTTRVLISTDLLSRGIDVYQVNLVINYDLPKSKETYIHRIGRCGRLGRKGTAINFVTPDEVQEMEEISNFYSTTVEELPTDLSNVGQK